MQHKLKIHWMHCVSCEILLEKSLNKIPWVKVISVNHKNWDLNLEISDNSKIKDIENKIKEMNYSINPPTSLAKEGLSGQDYIEIIWSFFVIWILIYLFKDIDFIKNTPTISENSWVFIAFLLWLTASISTCLALLWWIVISLWSATTENTNSNSRLLPHIYFNLWRIIWFSILWWLLWFIWTKFIVSPSINWILTIIIAFIMLYMWLQILNFVPNITKLWFHLPKSFTKNINNLVDSKNNLMPFIIWILTFFLPCWFTQSAQLAAIASWSILTWSIIMWAFALWTTPMLFALWYWSSFAQKSEFSLFKKLIWVLVIFFALFSFSNWMKLNWINVITRSEGNEWRGNLQVENNYKPWNSEVETINVIHTWTELEPYSIKLKEWINYKLIITPESDWRWCMFAMFIPNVDENPRYIKKWEKIEYDIKWLKKWTYEIICTAMGMQHGELIVNN